MQIVFEIASCPRRDTLPSSENCPASDQSQLASHLSLKTPTSQLFSSAPINNACEVFIRSMLLRAQYGGMKCDVQMLHSFASIWVKRFQSRHLPASLLDCVASESAQPICWWDFPRVLHEKARETSQKLVTSIIVCPGGLLKLTSSDVCSAGIDFHCSPVVEYLLSQRGLYMSLCERFTALNNKNEVADQDRLSGLIWDHSSGINHRRLLLETGRKKAEDSSSIAIWDGVLKLPFDEYTKEFVKDRLS